MKTARPRIPSPRTAGITASDVLYCLQEDLQESEFIKCNPNIKISKRSSMTLPLTVIVKI